MGMIVCLLMVTVAITLLPFVVYFCVKFGTVGFLRARESCRQIRKGERW